MPAICATTYGIFRFDPHAASFGTGKARIINVAFTDTGGHPLSWIVGGEEVALRIEVETDIVLRSPIIGFIVKDKLGQEVFGDNTFVSYIDTPTVCRPSDRLVGQFVFHMPRLASGDYSITVAIADGTQAEHVQHQWVHDALLFRSGSHQRCQRHRGGSHENHSFAGKKRMTDLNKLLRNAAVSPRMYRPSSVPGWGTCLLPASLWRPCSPRSLSSWGPIAGTHTLRSVRLFLKRH